MVTCTLPTPKGESMRPTVLNPSWQKCAHFRNANQWRLVIDDTSETLIAQFYLASPFKKGRSYFEVTPAGMAMLDHIVVTFIPVELRRREE